MSDTLLPIPLPKGVWVDLYAESEIDAGSEIKVINIGSTVIDLYSGIAAPTGLYGKNIARPWESYNTSHGDVGAWAKSETGKGLLIVSRRPLLKGADHIAMGIVPGVFQVKKFGFNPLVGADPETVWDQGGLYPYLNTAQAITISSSSDNDTEVGTGAQTATIEGVDIDYNLYRITVPLSGQDPVPVIANCFRVFRIFVDTAGLTGANIGTVYVGYGAVEDGIPANILGIVRIGYNQSQMAVYTVPAGKICFIDDYYNNTGEGKDATIESYARSYGGVFRLNRITSSFENNFYYPNRAPFYFDEKTDIEIRARSTAAGAPVSAGFDMRIVDKGIF